MTAWAFLSLAIGLEIAGTFFLKLSDGFAIARWGVLALLCYVACFAALAPAMKSLLVGMVYAIWAGVGIVAAAVMGVLMFAERLSALQIMFIALILVGSIGLRISTRV